MVVLVDEYDKPILDALDTPDVARANRDYLRGLYSTIKSGDAHVRFAFLTGVSKFSKVSVFSGLNNLTDVTLDPRYSAICGYTETDLDTVFAPELPGLDRDRIRDWYDGYSWRGAETVYNPFDVLLLLDTREFGCYWFESGTPTFLVEALFRRRVSSLSLDGMLASGELLSSFDVGAMATEALLFQTGYLTIKGVRDRGGVRRYRLGYPNREVRQSLNESLLRRLVQDATRQTANSDRLYDLLEANDFKGMETLFQAFFASIPYEWYTNNAIAAYEGYCASVFYIVLRGDGVRRRRGGFEPPRAGGHGGAVRGRRLPVRVQGGGAGGRGRRAGAAQGAGLRGQVPRLRRADPPDRSGVQQGDAQRDRVRGGARLLKSFPAVQTRKSARNVTAFEVERA